MASADDPGGGGGHGRKEKSSSKTKTKFFTPKTYKGVPISSLQSGSATSSPRVSGNSSPAFGTQSTAHGSPSYASAISRSSSLGSSGGGGGGSALQFLKPYLADIYVHVSSGQLNIRGIFRASPILICLVIFSLSMFIVHQAGPSGPQPDCPPNISAQDAAHERRSMVEEASSVKPEGSPSRGDLSGTVPLITIFSCPLPFTDDPDDPQTQALHSWAHLGQFVKVVLFGKHESLSRAAAKFPPGQVAVDKSIDFNLFGIPLLHSVLARAQAYDTDISILISPDVILLTDVLPPLLKIETQFGDWFATASTWSIPESGDDFKFRFDRQSPARALAGSFQEPAREFARGHGYLRTKSVPDFWAWNNSPVPLCARLIPPFAMVEGVAGRWVLEEVFNSGVRDTIDLSEVATVVHVAHVHWDKRVRRASPSGRKQRSLRSSQWERQGNLFLAHEQQGFDPNGGTAVGAEWKFFACAEADAEFMCIARRQRRTNCSCEMAPFTSRSAGDSFRIATTSKISCGLVPDAAPVAPNKLIDPHDSSRRSPVLSLREILQQVAHHVDNHLHIVTVVPFTISQRSLLMNFVCTLRRLHLDSNLLVAALDEEAYRFAFTRGIAVFFAPQRDEAGVAKAKKCGKGKGCLEENVPLRSEIVLQILKLGYSVVWSEVDEVWVSNPLPELLRHGRGSFLVQRNADQKGRLLQGAKGMNLGFFFARHDKKIIQAFQAIVERMHKLKGEEVMGFYSTLCASKKSRGAKPDECIWDRDLKVVFLENIPFSNGGDYDLWDTKNVTQTCLKVGCKILQTEGLQNSSAKVEKLVAHNLWNYHESRQLCLHSWYKTFQTGQWMEKGKKKSLEHIESVYASV